MRVAAHVTAVTRGVPGRDDRSVPVWSGQFVDDDVTVTVQRMLLALASNLPGRGGRGFGWGQANEIRISFVQEE